jgi:predicted enzyme related to lactoylglutathione lyase
VGERTSYAPGGFCWVELTTPGQAGAKDFYGSLFGWAHEDIPMGEDGSVYSMMKLDGKTVSAISAQSRDQAGTPAVWNTYVSVTDADGVAEHAALHGAEIVAPPFDVFDAGRMAIVKDPHGAFFRLWQPNQTAGVELVNTPGAWCWNELQSPDLDGSKAFYGELLGWELAPFEGSPTPYLIISNEGRGQGGIAPLQEGSPPAWLVYFAVADIEDSLAQVGEFGGAAITGTIDIGIAKIAIVSDPQGGVFALYAGELQE